MIHVPLVLHLSLVVYTRAALAAYCFDARYVCQFENMSCDISSGKQEVLMHSRSLAATLHVQPEIAPFLSGGELLGLAIAIPSEPFNSCM
jgi:hypothetical protein